MAGGMASFVRASSEDAPTARNISSRACGAGPMCRGAKWSDGSSPAGMDSANEPFIGILVEQRRGFRGIRQPDLCDPRGMRFLVDRVRVVAKQRVDLRNLPAHRREEFRYCLHRLDR